MLPNASSAGKTMAATQVCHKCGVNKQAGDFYRNRTNRDGLYNNCKACFSANSQRRQQHLPPMEQRMAEEKVGHGFWLLCLTSGVGIRWRSLGEDTVSS